MPERVSKTEEESNEKWRRLLQTMMLYKRLGAMLASIVGIIPFAHAHCPLCTGAVVAAAVTAKYYGLDLSIIGLLAGAFAISLGLWISKKVPKKIPGQTALLTVLSFAVTVLPLLPLPAVQANPLYIPVLWFGSSGTLFNKVYWISRFLLGGIIGGLLTIGSYGLHLKIKQMRGNVLFPFQGVVLTLIMLLIAGSVLFFTIGR